MTAPSPLPYAPRPKRRPGRFIWIAALLTISVLAIRWAPRAGRTASLLWWQYRCMTHTPSAQAIGLEVVLATDASKPKSPLPTGWHEFADKFGATRYPSVAPECAKFLQATGLQVYIPGDVLLFCHEMHTPGGDRRLVMVFANGKVLTEYQRVGNVLYPIVLTPATLRRAPEGMPQLQPIHDASNRTALEFDRGFRLYEGTLDPADPTRLLIAYEVDGKPGRIEGRLGKNGMLTLRVLDGPALTKEY